MQVAKKQPALFGVRLHPHRYLPFPCKPSKMLVAPLPDWQPTPQRSPHNHGQVLGDETACECLAGELCGIHFWHSDIDIWPS
mmetsp:Transcript_3294/g.7440  ORF Transcript_3294/g.7440 Transcript_3294/m.7440 type:complete len:82 (+) Transcript_3294:756-1001(+)